MPPTITLELYDGEGDLVRIAVGATHFEAWWPNRGIVHPFYRIDELRALLSDPDKPSAHITNRVWQSLLGPILAAQAEILRTNA